ncbi:hypothetical protein [Paraburkholderia phenazinium]|uniref:hypothetical protein n=1 Tax=Paraburkholderia phenazinium TaxID=60549 RepID=UPI001FC7DF51|nr:hypothetical protein [Paraburkholderia phenazinium]
MTAIAERAEAATQALRACRPSCAGCRYRADDRETLEQSIPGLTVFSSGFGASVAESRLCRLHDQFVSPQDSCGQFTPPA